VDRHSLNLKVRIAICGMICDGEAVVLDDSCAEHHIKLGPNQMLEHRTHVGRAPRISLKFLSLFMELRVKSSVEDMGLDANQHGEGAYGEEFGGGIPVGEEVSI
jgi:hypothetical protein